MIWHCPTDTGFEIRALAVCGRGLRWKPIFNVEVYTNTGAMLGQRRSSRYVDVTHLNRKHKSFINRFVYV